MSTTLILSKRTGTHENEEFEYTLEELAQAIEKRGKLGAGLYYDVDNDLFCTLGLMYYKVDGNKSSVLLSTERRSLNIETKLLRDNDNFQGTPVERAAHMVVKVRELDLSLGGIS